LESNGQSIFLPSKRGEANNVYVDNNYNHNLYFVQYERILICNLFALCALFYLIVNISQNSKFSSASDDYYIFIEIASVMREDF
jgi:hypothetical protein